MVCNKFLKSSILIIFFAKFHIVLKKVDMVKFFINQLGKMIRKTIVRKNYLQQKQNLNLSLKQYHAYFLNLCFIFKLANG